MCALCGYMECVWLLCFREQHASGRLFHSYVRTPHSKLGLGKEMKIVWKGNVGIQIHHIAPLSTNDIVWTINAQDVVRIGNYFLTGKLDTTLFTTIGGPGIKNPIHIKSRMGVQIENLIRDNLNEGNQRIISGDVLTGKKSDKDGFLGFYDSTVSVLPEGGDREFLGMLKPGSSQTRYSLTLSLIHI